MKNNRSSTSKFLDNTTLYYVLFLIVSVVWFIFMIPSSANLIPVHFRFTGQPDSFTSRSGFITIYVLTEIIIYLAIRSDHRSDNYLNTIFLKYYYKRRTFPNKKQEVTKRLHNFNIFNIFSFASLMFILFNFVLFYQQLSIMIGILILIAFVIIDALTFMLYVKASFS
ncbi:MAG TPA: hypothetical protein VKA34_13270 [Balneolales bacterium]|nr:hypothetical protein [Balneolales bacterium]